MPDPGWLATPAAALTLGIFLGAFTTGFAGFGLAAVAGAFLLHVIEPRTAVALMMVCSVPTQIAGLIYLRRTIAFRSASTFVAGGIAGLPVSILLMRQLNPETFRAVFGSFLVLYTGWMLARLALAPLRNRPAVAALGAPLSASRPILAGSSHLVHPVIGFFAGIVGGMTAMPSALICVWADATGMNKEQPRGLVQPFIHSMQVCALVMLAAFSPGFARELSPYLATAAMPLALGTACGLFCYGRADPALFRLVVLVIVFLSGSALLLR